MGVFQRITDAFVELQSSFLAFLPGLAIGAVIFLFFILLSRYVQYFLATLLARRYPENFSQTIALLLRWIIVALAFFMSAVVAFPSVSFATLIGSLGVSSIAIGFAFKDIFQNLLAGVLLIFRQPFSIGDVMEVRGFKGQVLSITIRETRLLTEQGDVIIIPNADVYSSPLKVFRDDAPGAF